MLFKAYPGMDTIKIIWMIPKIEMWDQFSKDKMTANPTMVQSIYDFQHNRELLEQKEEDDLEDYEIDAIYQQISIDAKKRGTVYQKI